MNIKYFAKLAITQPGKLIETVLRIPQIGRYVSDETAIKLFYYLRFQKRINLNSPQTFNEKLLWLTLHDRRPEYTLMVDKFEAKNWITQKLVGGVNP